MAEDPEVIDEEEALALSTAEESSALEEKLSALAERCNQFGIDFLKKYDEDGTPYATISIPSGRKKRTIGIYSESRANSLLNVPFEKFTFLSGYEAICCHDAKSIEVGLKSNRLSASMLFERLQNHRPPTPSKPIKLDPPEPLRGRPSIEIGQRSTEFSALTGSLASRITLKLNGIRSTQHDQALSELRSYADSLFLQIDTMVGSTFVLERERRTRLISTIRRNIDLSVIYPVTHYNEEAMSLYWYAKSARDMPLLRFLAFYQAIEFYFPRYSQTEARKRVGSIIKNPTFRPHRDDDLDRVISAIQLSRGGGIGNERSQLRAVINECIGADEIRRHLTSSPELEDHFSGKKGKSKYHKIPLGNKGADLRNDAADRIYDIRCKIVHTKNEHTDGDHPMILPFSDDADYLLHDINLVEFIAKGVLVASSGELT